MLVTRKCPTCGSLDCIRPAGEVQQQAFSMYVPCARCRGDQPLDKFIPLVELGLELDRDSGRCPFCGKRHLDYIMASVLDILIKEGIKDAGAALKDVGTPLVAFGVTMVDVPRLPAKSLVMVIDNVNKHVAKRILDEVPEVKGVLNRKGKPSDSVGILDTGSKPHVYQLMAGCDMRADVISCMLGDLCLYRGQSDCHIEFWRNNSVKVKAIEKLFLDGLLDDSVVVDGLASVGTLGLLAALGGAKKVVLNDAWLPAIRNLLLNIEVNQDALGVEMERIVDLSKLPAIGDEPVLVAKASGNVELEVYIGDFRKLDSVVPSCDVCIIDTFPGVSPEEFEAKWQGLATKKIIVL
ncbi:conserved hypothetical protein [Methanocella paludicola SANAE]|uniref:Methyltransferase n=1 Tax=Methanocella paludicola (strain DSM 17711 / JCM 13418 / NBRC 101707 / SANAE) TaxID=304371 RepID=D1YYH7_METPS|nr:hypothetical protein [Methanocella paludicola]BAI61499.1 conserved hypothetical protein [Methanocella paludicola SANAE]